MIHTEGLATTITNGKDGVGAVVVDGIANEVDAKLIIRALNAGVSIGNKPTPEQINELPSVTIEFFDTRSIDVYIEGLKMLKRRMEGRMMYAMAC